MIKFSELSCDQQLLIMEKTFYAGARREESHIVMTSLDMIQLGTRIACFLHNSLGNSLSCKTVIKEFGDKVTGSRNLKHFTPLCHSKTLDYVLIFVVFVYEKGCHVNDLKYRCYGHKSLHVLFIKIRKH